MSTKTNLQPTSDAKIHEGATIHYVDPATLLVDHNVRTDARLDKEFLASVRDLGVLVPIVAVRTTAGALRVRYGHRRALAAVEAGHAYAPVVVVADEATDEAADIDRLVGQYAENEHRLGLSTAERVEVFSQLSAFGMSAGQIAKRTKTRRGEVDAALAVSGSEVAQAVSARYDFLDLMQAAVVAEFSDDKESVKALVKAARDGGFDHLAQRLRDQRAEAVAVATVSDALTASGVRVIERPPYGDRLDLDDLLTEAGDGLAVEDHASCPGHAAYVQSQWAGMGDDTDHEEGIEYVAVYVCTDPRTYGHRSRWDHQAGTRPGLSDDERAAANAERRWVVGNNKAWRSASAVRREWLAGFLARKTAPKGAAAFVAGSLARADYDLRKALEWSNPLADQLLGSTAATLAEAVSSASDGRAQVVGLGLVLAAHEQATGTHSWRSVSEATARYLGYLEAQGYELSEVEQLAGGRS